MCLCVLHDLFDFGCGHVFSINATNTFAFSMDLQHYTGSLFGVHVKKFLQYVYDKIHRGEVIVKKQDLVKRWGLYLGA